jgi:hypothetical protein
VVRVGTRAIRLAGPYGHPRGMGGREQVQERANFTLREIPAKRGGVRSCVAPLHTKFYSLITPPGVILGLGTVCDPDQFFLITEY